MSSISKCIKVVNTRFLLLVGWLKIVGTCVQKHHPVYQRREEFAVGHMVRNSEACAGMYPCKGKQGHVVSCISMKRDGSVM